jgi:hypothetical protein
MSFRMMEILHTLFDFFYPLTGRIVFTAYPDNFIDIIFAQCFQDDKCFALELLVGAACS